MYSFAGTESRGFNAGRLIGGVGSGDGSSYRILYAGADPSDSKKMLVKKVF